MSFLSTYAAIRLTTGKRAPSISGRLLKAAGLTTLATALVPVAGFRLLAGIRLTPQQPAPPTPPQGAERGAFGASVDQLQEDMKS